METVKADRAVSRTQPHLTQELHDASHRMGPRKTPDVHGLMPPEISVAVELLLLGVF